MIALFSCCCDLPSLPPIFVRSVNLSAHSSYTLLNGHWVSYLAFPSAPEYVNEDSISGYVPFSNMYSAYYHSLGRSQELILGLSSIDAPLFDGEFISNRIFSSNTDDGYLVANCLYEISKYA